MRRLVTHAAHIGSFVLILVAACGGGGGFDDDGHDDAGPADAGGDAGADAGSDAGDERQLECPAEPDEDCVTCYERVGDCCLPGDAAWEAQEASIAASCSANPDCAACCNECAAMSCAEMAERHLCPMGS